MMLNQWPRATDYGGRTYLMALRGGGEGRSREPRRSMGQEGAGLPDGVGKRSPRGREKNLVGVGLGFLIMTLRTQEMKGKVDKCDYFRLICLGIEKKAKWKNNL